MKNDYIGRNYSDERQDPEEKEKSDMRNRADRKEIDQYKQKPYANNIVKRGNYTYESQEEIKVAQAANQAKIREVLNEMKSIQDKVAEVIETQKRLDEVLCINNPQTRVDNDTKQVSREDD